MAKKKSVKKPGNSGDDAGIDRSASGSPPVEQDTSSEVAQDTPEPTAGADAASPNVDSEIAAEMASLKAENQKLKEQLAAKDAELEALRAQVQESGTGSVKFDRSKLEDVEKLQARLATLRKEQAEADAVRDAAWKQLKNVVGEITKLASPDYLASVNVPMTA